MGLSLKIRQNLNVSRARHPPTAHRGDLNEQDPDCPRCGRDPGRVAGWHRDNRFRARRGFLPGLIIGGIVGGAIVGATAPRGYVVYPGYNAPLNGPGCYWTRQPVYDPYGNIVGWRGRPFQVCQ